MSLISKIYGSPNYRADVGGGRNPKQKTNYDPPKKKRDLEYWKRRALRAEYRRGKREREGFYETDAWRTVRYQAIKRSNRCCEACGSRKGPFHVDHIKPRSRFPDLALSLHNLQVLCKDCNLGKGAWDETDWRKSTPGT